MIIDELTKQIIIEAQAGDHDAFERLYTKFYGEVYSFARYLLKSDSKAEDVLQTTFLKVFHKLPELKTVEAFSSWIYTITQNECRMMMRKKDERILFLDTQDAEYAMLVDVDPEIPAFGLEAEADRQFIKQEVSKLPVHQRAAIVYFYYLNMSVKEISQLLSCNENTIKSRLFAGRSVLKKSILELQERLGNTLAFSMMPLSTLLGNQVLQQSIPDKAAKAIFMSISSQIGVGIGHVSLLYRLRKFIRRTIHQIERVGIVAIILILLFCFSGVTAAGLYLNSAMAFKNLSAGQIEQPTVPEEASCSTQIQLTTIIPTTVPAGETEILPAIRPSATPPDKNDYLPARVTTEETCSLTIEPSPVVTIIPTNQPTATVIPAPSVTPTVTFVPSIMPLPTSTPFPTVTPIVTAVPSPTPTPTITSTPTLSAAEIAGSITMIDEPVKSDVCLVLPVVPAGYLLEIKSSSDPAVIAADGIITPVEMQQTVDIVLTVTKISDDTKADTQIIKVVLHHFLSSSTDLSFDPFTGTKLAGVAVGLDPSVPYQDGLVESNQTLLIVEIDSDDKQSAIFLPVTDHATVTAVTAPNDAGLNDVQSREYLPVEATVYNFTSPKYLWIKVVSEDLTNTRYYSLYVKAINYG